MASRFRRKPITARRGRNNAAAGRAVTTENRGARGRPRSNEAQRAILDATLELLAETGMSGFTVEGVAARAGVGKATIYRRWSSRLPLVVNAIMTLPELRVPASGTARGDLRQILSDLVTILRSSPLGRVLPHLVAERGTDAKLDHAVAHYLAVRRAPVVTVIRRGIERGEIPPDIDADALADLVVGPIINRLLFSRRPVNGSFIDLVITTVLAGAMRTVARGPRTARVKR